MGLGNIWGMLRKFGPVALIAGYIIMYYTQKSNGVNQILPDLQNISLERLMSNWKNIAVAIGAFLLLSFLHKIKMPAAMRALAQVGLYFLIGWEIALAIDPPERGASRSSSSPVRFVSPSTANPYARG